MNEAKEKRPDYLVLINEDHRLADGFEDTVEKIVYENADGERFLIEKKTCEAFLRLQEDILKNDSIHHELISVYRSVKEQEDIFTDHVHRFGIEYTTKYVAKPGRSEHHTGFSIDVGIILDGKIHRTKDELFALAHLFQSIHKKAPQYGFILRYPKGKESITKICYEPWHFRYIDAPEIAKEITDKGICFEEYCQKA